MKALLCREYGPVERLAVEDVPSPRPGHGDVVIEVKASALNFPDALMVQGQYQVKPPLPFSPGMELAGIGQEVGTGVHRLARGERGGGFPGGGGLARGGGVGGDRVAPLPPGVDFETAPPSLLPC